MRSTAQPESAAAAISGWGRRSPNLALGCIRAQLFGLLAIAIATTAATTTATPCAAINLSAALIFPTPNTRRPRLMRFAPSWPRSHARGTRRSPGHPVTRSPDQPKGGVKSNEFIIVKYIHAFNNLSTLAVALGGHHHQQDDRQQPAPRHAVVIIKWKKRLPLL